MEMYYAKDRRGQSLRTLKGNPFLEYEDQSSNYIGCMYMLHTIGLSSKTISMTTVASVDVDFEEYLNYKKIQLAERTVTGSTTLEHDYGDDFDDYEAIQAKL